MKTPDHYHQNLLTSVMLIFYISGIRFVQSQLCFTIYLPKFSYSSDILFSSQYRKAPEGSDRKTEAQKKFAEAMSHRMHLDSSIQLIGKVLFGLEKGPVVMNTVRSAGKPLVDDWACLKTLVNIRPLNIDVESTFLKIEIN